MIRRKQACLHTVMAALLFVAQRAMATMLAMFASILEKACYPAMRLIGKNRFPQEARSNAGIPGPRVSNSACLAHLREADIDAAFKIIRGGHVFPGTNAE